MAKAKAKALKTKDNVATLIYVPVKNLLANPYRDMTMFPIDLKKVESLKESIEQTGFWPSIIARPKNNMVDGAEITQSKLDKLLKSKKFDPSSIEWEKAFAHHRQAACEALGFDTIPIIPQIMSDEQMLQMMANENKEGFGSNINSMMETVRQVKQKLEESIADYDDYDAYKEALGDDAFFKTAKSFVNAQKQGVGFRTIRRFLGETWSDRDVRAPLTVLKAVEDGLFHQEDIVGVPSIGLLEGIASLARIIWEGYQPKGKDAEFVDAPDWPDYYKTACVDEVIRRCSVNPEEGKHHTTVTVALLDKARQALLKNGVNPASYLRTGKGKTAFDVYRTMKEEFLVPDKDLEHNLAIIAGFKEMDGFANWAGLDDICEKLKKAAENMAAGVEESDGGDVDLEGGEDTGNVDDLLHGGEEGADNLFDAGDFPVDVAMMASQIRNLPEDAVSEEIVDSLLDMVGEAVKVLNKAGHKEELVEMFRSLK